MRDQLKTKTEKNSNKSIFLKDYNVPSSDMKDVTQRKCKSFDIGECVTLFELNNMELNGQVGVLKLPIEPPDRQDIPLYSPPLQWF